MKSLRAVLLMEPESGERAIQLAHTAGIKLDAEIVSDLIAISRLFNKPPELLLSFGTSIIVPEYLLELPGLLALNVHAASPDYPGRDPHHFAVYDSVSRYGATMHFMTTLVDAGQIVDVALFDVNEGVTPERLLEQANQAAWVLIEKLFMTIASGNVVKPIQDFRWGQRKTTRKMFLDLCRVDGAMSEVEFKRRMQATAMPGYSNLYVEIHGHIFRMDDKI